MMLLLSQNDKREQKFDTKTISFDGRRHSAKVHRYVYESPNPQRYNRSLIVMTRNSSPQRFVTIFSVFHNLFCHHGISVSNQKLDTHYIACSGKTLKVVQKHFFIEHIKFGSIICHDKTFILVSF